MSTKIVLTEVLALGFQAFQARRGDRLEEVEPAVLVVGCPCGVTVATVPIGTGQVDELAVRLVIEAHLDACIVMAAGILTKQATSD